MCSQYGVTKGVRSGDIPCSLQAALGDPLQQLWEMVSSPGPLFQALS